MKFACPRCSAACGLFKGACPNCGLSLTLGSLLKFYFHRTREVLSQASALSCPACGFPNPLQARECANCHSDLSVRVAMDSVVEPRRRRWHRFLRGIAPENKRRIQWVYLIFSAALLWWLLAYVEHHGGDSWVSCMLLSVVYVAVLAFCALWLIPRKIFRTVFHRATARTKLSLALNALSLMIVLQLCIREWWARAATLAGMFAVAWFAGWLLYRFILPMAQITENVFLGPDREFDPAAPQGRSARFD
jgi:hypothetical protein